MMFNFGKAQNPEREKPERWSVADLIVLVTGLSVGNKTSKSRPPAMGCSTFIAGANGTEG